MDFVFTLVASIVLIISLYNLYNAVICRSWPITQGEITQANTNSKRVSFYYEYSINEEIYLGKRIFFGDIFLSWIGFSVLQRTLNQYQAGQKVVVHYSPSNPNKAVLETGIKWQSYFSVLLAVVLFVVARLV
ncbi:MAG: DUF3592 domain-containing protein [Anaerolineales bacterium]